MKVFLYINTKTNLGNKFFVEKQMCKNRISGVTYIRIVSVPQSGAKSLHLHLPVL